MSMKLKIGLQKEKPIVHEDGTTEKRTKPMFNRSETRRIKMKSLKGANYQKSFYDDQNDLGPIAKEITGTVVEEEAEESEESFFNMEKIQKRQNTVSPTPK